MTLYRSDRARNGAQAEHMELAQEKGRCVFCDIDFSINKPLDRNGNIDLSGTAWKYWWIWWNPFPQNHQRHLMFILKRHATSQTPEKIFFKEWYELIHAMLWAIIFFKFYGGGFDFRFGDTRYNAGTIPGHFHAQIQAPWGTGQVFALFYPDLSPLEQARTANRMVYRNKKLQSFAGYIVRSQNYILNKNFHWERFNSSYAEAYVHSAEALPHIAAIFTGKELRPEWMLPTKYTRGADNIPLAETAEAFTFCEALDVANYFNNEAYERTTVLGYAFKNSEGFYLSRNFEWDSPTYVIHAEQAYDYVLAVFHDPSITIFDAEIATDGSNASINEGAPIEDHLKRYFYR